MAAAPYLPDRPAMPAPARPTVIDEERAANRLDTCLRCGERYYETMGGRFLHAAGSADHKVVPGT